MQLSTLGKNLIPTHRSVRPTRGKRRDERVGGKFGFPNRRGRVEDLYVPIMKIGITIHATDRAMDPVEVAREV